MVGIRVDSGDLAWLSIEARKLLDAAGFQDAAIVASNDLDERLIASLKQQGAAITIWGVGTKLVTAYDQPALGGVYKLGAIQEAAGAWHPKIKLSQQLIKTSTPGIQQVCRIYDANDLAVADMIYNVLLPLPKTSIIVDPLDAMHRREISPSVTSEDLLQPMIRGGSMVTSLPSISDVRSRTMRQLQQFHTSILRFDNPHRYPVRLEHQLHDSKLHISDCRTRCVTSRSDLNYFLRSSL